MRYPYAHGWWPALVLALVGATAACSNGTAGVRAQGGAGGMASGGAGTSGGVDGDASNFFGAGGMTGTSGEAGGATAETFICATGMFSLNPPGTGNAFSAYVLTLTPAAGGYAGALQLEPLDRVTMPATPPVQPLEINGVVGRDAIDVTFPGGSVQVAPLPDGPAGVLDGDARFEQAVYGFFGQLESVAIACWSTTSARRFHYDPGSGRCLDAAGAEGREAVTVPRLRETRNGECATLSAGRHVEPQPLVAGQVSLNEIDVGYPSLSGWNLGGATLAGGALYFALLLDADLRGADLTGFKPGYFGITATIDAYTTGLDPITCLLGSRSNERWECCTVGGACQ